MKDNKTLLFLGREPALWMSLFASFLAVFSSFIFALTIDQQGVLNGAVYAGFGLAAAIFIDEGALATSITGMFKALLAVGLAFGLHLVPEQQSMIMALVSAGVALAIRPQVIPVNPPESSAADRKFSYKPKMLMASRRRSSH